MNKVTVQVENISKNSTATFSDESSPAAAALSHAATALTAADASEFHSTAAPPGDSMQADTTSARLEKMTVNSPPAQVKGISKRSRNKRNVAELLPKRQLRSATKNRSISKITPQMIQAYANSQCHYVPAVGSSPAAAALSHAAAALSPTAAAASELHSTYAPPVDSMQIFAEISTATLMDLVTVPAETKRKKRGVSISDISLRRVIGKAKEITRKRQLRSDTKARRLAESLANERPDLTQSIDDALFSNDTTPVPGEETSAAQLPCISLCPQTIPSPSVIPTATNAHPVVTMEELLQAAANLGVRPTDYTRQQWEDMLNTANLVVSDDYD